MNLQVHDDLETEKDNLEKRLENEVKVFSQEIRILEKTLNQGGDEKV